MNVQDYREQSQVIIEGGISLIEKSENGIRVSLNTGYGIFISYNDLHQINHEVERSE